MTSRTIAASTSAPRSRASFSASARSFLFTETRTKNGTRLSVSLGERLGLVGPGDDAVLPLPVSQRPPGRVAASGPCVGTVAFSGGAAEVGKFANSTSKSASQTHCSSQTAPA